VPDRKT